MTPSHDNSVYTTIQHWELHLHYIQYSELYLHNVHINIQYIYFFNILNLNVFQCLLLHANTAHANMPVIYLFSISIFFILVFLYFCVKGNLQIKNLITWCKLCVYDNKTSSILNLTPIQRAETISLWLLFICYLQMKS